VHPSNSSSSSGGLSTSLPPSLLPNESGDDDYVPDDAPELGSSTDVSSDGE
jgi:hypothetical protein